MIRSLVANVVVAFRQPFRSRQPASNVCLCKSLEFKKIKSEVVDNGIDEAVKKRRPKTVPLPKITLLGLDRQLSVVTMDVAVKMSERRGLKLVKVIDIDTKTQRPVYQMMTAAQFLEVDGQSKLKIEKKSDGKKSSSEKTALINCRIGEADLESKVNNFRKWLNKEHEVRVTVSGDTANEIADKIIKMTQECSRVVQRREKGSFVKFQLLPPKKT